MSNTRIICYGESVDNLKMTFDYKIIGISKKYFIDPDDDVYFAIKRNKQWYICGKTKVKEETDLNPFTNSGNYCTYLTEDCIPCIPFSISNASREILGLYWGLIFQNPSPIKNQKFILFLQKSFVQATEDALFKSLEDN